ncbi:MAG: hypothetical protein ABL971_01535 [Vicinamibacterales bacterium]
MTRRMVGRAACVVLVTVCLAIVGGVHPALAQNALPPDQQALRAARLLDDPQQQLDALRRVAADYPDSRYAERARMAALDVLAKRFPGRSAEIRKQADLLTKDADPADPGMYDDVATVLVDAGVELAKARALSEKTVRAFTEKAYLKAARKDYAEAKQPLPELTQLSRSYLTTRAALLGTLGRIYLKLGDHGRAQQTFEDAERGHPSAQAAEGLGAIAMARGQEDVAYPLLLRARITGVLSPENRLAFESLFARRHGGNLVGLEPALDDAYRALGPNPVHPERHVPAAPGNRVVLLEMFTGAGCPPCAGADLAVDALRERYTPGQLVVLMHHVHIPRPDPMSNPDTVARSDLYAIPGAPTFIVDGTHRDTGGGPRENANRPYTRVSTLIDAALAEPAGASLAVDAALTGRTVAVRVRPALTASAGKPVVRVALVERELRYSGENGIRFHPMVVRALVDRPITGDGTVSAEFDVDTVAAGLASYLDGFERRNDRFGPVRFVEKLAAIDAANLGVVVFLQDDDSKRVLQSAYVDLAVRANEERK